MKIDLTGKKALVGGSSKGIGLGIATELANSGASVCLMARNESRLKQIVDKAISLKIPMVAIFPYVNLSLIHI